MVNSPRQISRGLAVAVLIALATAVTSHLIGRGRDMSHALTDGFKLSYCVAAALAAAAAVATFVLMRKTGREGRHVTRGVRIAVASAAVAVCFVGTDFSLGLLQGSPIGAYTTRGADTFVSAPTLHPPIVRADVSTPGWLQQGYVFTADFYNPSIPGSMVGQSGPLILDHRLSPVWFQPVSENVLAANLSLQTYEGRPVLAWWQGVINRNALTTQGEYVVVDQHYRPVARLRGADGWVLALHDFVIRGDDAWVTANKNVRLNLSRYGGAGNGMLLDSAVQEYNLKTGKLLRSWDALDHVPLSESMVPVPTDGSLWDAYHLNSIDLPGDGTFVISMRSTWAAYKVDIATGRIEWTLGGKQSSFRFGSGAEFQWQHDVMVYRGTPLVTVFDDHCCEITSADKLVATGPSRGLVLKLDSTRHTASLVDQYTRGATVDSEFMGSIEPLPGGNEFVGWGSLGPFAEYTATGRTLLDAVMPGSDVTYRATVEPWVGLPLYPPSGAARQQEGRTIVYASWNGATQVASWRVLAGSSSSALKPVTAAPRSGFETAIALPRSYEAFRVQALNRAGDVIGSSKPFTIAG